MSNYHRTRRLFLADDLRHLAARLERTQGAAHHAPRLHKAAKEVTAPLSPNAADLLRDLLGSVGDWRHAARPAQMHDAIEELRSLLPIVTEEVAP